MHHSECRCDLIDTQFARGDGHDKAIHIIVGSRAHTCFVEFQKNGRRKPTKPLVAIYERMVPDDGMKQSTGLAPDVRICVLAKR